MFTFVLQLKKQTVNQENIGFGVLCWAINFVDLVDFNRRVPCVYTSEMQIIF